MGENRGVHDVSGVKPGTDDRVLETLSDSLRRDVMATIPTHPRLRHGVTNVGSGSAQDEADPLECHPSI
jgi:hypothetical protein